MAPNDNWQIPLPNPEIPTPATPGSLLDEVDQVLREVTRQVDGKYNSHGIQAASTKTSRLDPDQEVVLNYAFYLSFPAQNHFSYRLFELVSHVPNGGLPVEVTAFTGPAEPLGQASTPAELKQIINKVFDNPRTRWLINTYYKP